MSRRNSSGSQYAQKEDWQRRGIGLTFARVRFSWCIWRKVIGMVSLGSLGLFQTPHRLPVHSTWA